MFPTAGVWTALITGDPAGLAFYFTRILLAMGVSTQINSEPAAPGTFVEHW